MFQTAGSKQWEVHGEDGPEEVLLEPGLSMYLPTGTPHAARAQETVSLHVTLGINQLTWRGLVERTLAQVVADVPAEHLPAGYLDDPALLTGPLAERLAGARRGGTTHRRRRGRRDRDPALPHLAPVRGSRAGVTDVLALRAGIDDDTRLRRRPGHPCVLLDDGDQVVVLLGDRSLTVPGLDPARPRGDPRPRVVHRRRPRRPPRRPEPDRCSAGAWSGRGCSRRCPDRRGRRPSKRFSCAAASLLRDEPVAGTATHVRTWVLLEHSGPWGDDALLDARLPDGLGPALKQQAKDLPRQDPAGPARPGEATIPSG